jgi:hypothetical protein
MISRLLCQLCCVSAVALPFLGGCAATGAPGRYMVTSVKSPFYKYGPAQSFGADFTLPRGQKLTVVENSFGFAKVTTDDGMSGYMPTEDLTPAPPEPVVAATTAARVTRNASRRVTSQVRGEETFVAPPLRKSIETDSPLFNVNDVPLPTNPEKPKAPAKP